MNTTRECVTIRVATFQDISPISAIWLENVHLSYDPSVVPPNVDEATQYWNKKLQEQSGVYPIWVAEDESGVLGFLALSPLYSGHPVLRLGAQLMKKAVSHCNTSPLKFIMATTTVENTSSQKVLQRLGWQKLGTIPSSAKAPQLPALLYYFYAAKDQDTPFNTLPSPTLIAV